MIGWARRRPIVATVATVALFSLTGTAAYAYWTSTGSGTATASVGTTQPITIVGTTTGLLYPGATGLTMSLTASNPGSAPIKIGVVHADSFSAYDSYTNPTTNSTTNSGACQALIDDTSFADFTMADVDELGQVIAAGASNTPLAVTGTLTFNSSPTVNQDACKSKVIVVSLSAAAF